MSMTFSTAMPGMNDAPPGLGPPPSQKQHPPKDAVTDAMRQLLEYSNSPDSLSSSVPQAAWFLDTTKKAPIGVPMTQDVAWSPDAKAYPKPRTLCSLKACAGEPVKVEVPSMKPRKPQAVGVSEQMHVQRAAADLQEALANWEAATQHLHAKPAAPKMSAAPKAAKAGASALPTVNEEFIPIDGGDPVEAKCVYSEGSPADGVLQHVVSGLLDVAKEQLSVNEAVVPDEDHANMVLRKCLEEQQAKSLEKINLMMQAQATPAWQQAMGCMGGHADMNYGWGQQMPLGMTQQHAGVPFGTYGMPGDPMWLQAQLQAQQTQAHMQALAIASMKAQNQQHMQTHGARGGGQGRGPGGRVRPNAAGGGVKKKPPIAAGGSEQHTNAEEDETLKTHLRNLQDTDPGKVLIIRKINRIGFNSPAVLQAHYSKYGPVQEIRVAHSYVKSTNRRCASRLRPSGLGFLVMANAGDVETILRDGEEQQVEGSLIKVQRFEQRNLDVLDDEAQNCH